MSFEPDDLPGTSPSSLLARKLALALIPIVTAVPVTVAVLNKSQNEPTLKDAIASLEESGEILPPERLESVSGLPKGPTEAKAPDTTESEEETSDDSSAVPNDGIPPGPVDPESGQAIAPQTLLAEGAETELESAPETEPQAPEEFSPEIPESGDETALPSEPELPVNHTVQPGDTLYRIGRENGVTPEEIAEANGIEMDSPILPGQVLQLPGGGNSADLPPGPSDSEFGGASLATTTTTRQDFLPSPPLPPLKTGTESSETYYPEAVSRPVSGSNTGQSAQPIDQYCIAYVVHEGDTLESIAFSHSTTQSVLRALNQGVPMSAGQVLMIPIDRILTTCQ